ncbi:Protein of unknown function [Polaromonas sp. YR568]|uniref:DUF2523 family protein n=1 Tax=Polaromonas sp. YR568 TaxID=1855301 RepID=UPI0008E53BE9|nr:DUF2523 family protein [Polaromonas sp. YR568]SFV04530.1 Protein of unknown function [Polaromonas sp. YR568]
MGALFSMLFQKIAGLLKWIGDLFVACFVAIWDLLKDLFCWMLDESLKIAVSAISTLDVSGISSNLAVFGQIPANVMQVMGALGVGQALAIIGAALAIRFLLQLIPFVRLGS